IRTLNNITIYNFMTSNQLEESIAKSEVIISRSGYTTLMDLAVLEKKAFFIPTPGQSEQEYLAEHMQHLQFAPYTTQQEFKLDDLKQLNNYKGLSKPQESIDFGAIFAVFN
ncbi:MAG: glycosyltransferase, partial [Flavobacteriaceae bacterium]